MTPAVKSLQRLDVCFSLQQYDHDPRASGYAKEAALALGVKIDSVFKTLCVKVDGKALAIAIVPASKNVNMKALAAAAGGKRAQMATPQEAQRATGYVVGGISPFGQKRKHLTLLDDSAMRLDVIHVSGGRRGLEITIAPGELLRALDARPVAIT